MVKNNIESFNILDKLHEHEKQFKKELAKTFLEYMDSLSPIKRIEQMELLLYDTQHQNLSTLDRRLTPQERKCLYLASKGKEIKETARILGLSQRTIKFHRANITKKFGVPNLMAAVGIANQSFTVNCINFDILNNFHALSNSVAKISRSKYLKDKEEINLRWEDNPFISIFDFMGINYSIIDLKGNYIFQNNSAIINITKGLSKAKDIDPLSWSNCQLVMKNKEKILIEERFDEKFFLSIKQPILNKDTCLGILIISYDITNQRKSQIAKKTFLLNKTNDLKNSLDLITVKIQEKGSPNQNNISQLVNEASGKLLELISLMAN
ncbi:MAG: hypothetical protein RLY40_906 [Pseudomonadota bacterium]|jgi:DNA-binding CsgD family transcriptional regulator